MPLRLSCLVLVLVGCGEGYSTTPPQVEISAPPVQSDPGPDEVVASWSGGQITWAELSSQVADHIRTLEIEYRLNRYEVATQALSSLVDDALLEEEARRRKMSGVDELLVAEVEARVQMPTDAEVAAFYPVVERRLEGVSLEVAAPYLRMELLQRAQAERYAVFIEELRSKAGVELAIPYPDLPRADIPIEDHDPVLGPADAAVTIVQFAEYQCYFCQKVQPTVDQLMEAYPGEVRMVLKDFPLSGHGRAIPAAVAAHCAGEQGNYWQMYDVLLSNQQALGDADLVRYGQELGIDEQRYRACLTDGRHEASIYDDMAVARQLGVQATPTFFINGVVFPGAQPYERFASLIDRELGR